MDQEMVEVPVGSNFWADNMPSWSRSSELTLIQVQYDPFPLGKLATLWQVLV